MSKQVSSESKVPALNATDKQKTCHKIRKFIRNQIIICFQSAVLTTAIYALALALDRVVARKPLTHRADRHFKWASIFLWSTIFFVIYALVFYWKKILRLCATSSFILVDKEQSIAQMKKEEKCDPELVKTSNDAVNVLTVKVEKSETNKNVTDRTVINYESTRVIKSHEASSDVDKSSTEEVKETTDDDQGDQVKSGAVMVHSNDLGRHLNNHSLIFHINPHSLTPVSVGPHHIPVSGYNVPIIVGPAVSGGHPFPPFPPTYYNNYLGGDVSSPAMSHMHTFNSIDYNTNYNNNSNAHLTALTAGPSAPPYPQM